MAFDLSTNNLHLILLRTAPGNSYAFNFSRNNLSIEKFNDREKMYFELLLEISVFGSSEPNKGSF